MADVRVFGATLVLGTLIACAWVPWISYPATALLPIVQCARAWQQSKVRMLGHFC